MHTDSEKRSLSSVEAWVGSKLQNPDLASSLRGPLLELERVLAAERAKTREYFLSVVIRTQARRLEQLQDALLCLAAQTDQDFEILLMLHNVEESLAEQLGDLLQSYPESFRERVSTHQVSGGNRTRPLAAAIPSLRGAYVAFFDDDDLLMANWVEVFHTNAEVAPGQLIRVNVATQLNRIEVWGEHAVGQRSVSVATAEYVDRFNLLDNVKVNHTPFMGIAFPTSFFTLWGEAFDEALPVCEDWDVLMRAAGLLGVQSAEEITAIYRQWENTQTSYTLHNSEEWQRAEQSVQHKIDAVPSFLPAGSVAEILAVLEREHKIGKALGDRLHEVLSSSSWRLTSPIRSAVRWVRRGSNGRR